MKWEMCIFIVLLSHFHLAVFLEELIIAPFAVDEPKETSLFSFDACLMFCSRLGG